MLTKEQILVFSQLDTYYKSVVPLVGTNDNIRSACESAHEFAIGNSTKTAIDLADALIMPSDAPIAYVNGAVCLLWKHAASLPPGMTSGVFKSIVEKMLDESLSVQRISRRHFADLRNEFFETARVRANQCFNRFAFACFPHQFCSVVSPKRLWAVINELDRCGLLPSNDGRNAKANEPDAEWHNARMASIPPQIDTEWYDLCETIVPLLKEAFSHKDYAEHSCFLARIGEHLHRMGVPV